MLTHSYYNINESVMHVETCMVLALTHNYSLGLQNVLPIFSLEDMKINMHAVRAHGESGLKIQKLRVP